MPQNRDVVGTCYVASSPGASIREGAAYRLEIDLPGGGSLRSRTRVPGSFDMVTPRARECRWRACP